MKKIIRTSDLRLGKLQEVPTPKFKPITTMSLGDIIAKRKDAQKEFFKEATKTLTTHRPIAEKIVTTESVSEFKKKYAKIIAEEKEKLEERKRSVMKETIERTDKEMISDIVKKKGGRIVAEMEGQFVGVPARETEKEKTLSEIEKDEKRAKRILEALPRKDAPKKKRTYKRKKKETE